MNEPLVDFSLHDARTNVSLTEPRRYGWRCLICGMAANMYASYDDAKLAAMIHNGGDYNTREVR